MNVRGLVQLCEAAAPCGGYAHALGIEDRARRHELRSADELAAALRQALGAAIGPADGVASGIAFRAARDGDLQEIPPVCHVMSSGRLPVEMRLESLHMGRRLWELSRHWDWATAIHAELDELTRTNDLHHAVAFGALVSEATSSQVRAIATYLFNIARGIVAAAVRAIPLDEAAGQRVLATVQPAIAELAGRCANKHPQDIATLRAEPWPPGPWPV